MLIMQKTMDFPVVAKRDSPSWLNETILVKRDSFNESCFTSILLTVFSEDGDLTMS